MEINKINLVKVYMLKFAIFCEINQTKFDGQGCKMELKIGESIVDGWSKQ